MEFQPRVTKFGGLIFVFEFQPRVSSDLSQPRSRRVSDEMDLSQEIGEDSDADDHEEAGAGAAGGACGEMLGHGGGARVTDVKTDKWRVREEEQNRIYRRYQERMAANPVSVSG